MWHQGPQGTTTRSAALRSLGSAIAVVAVALIYVAGGLSFIESEFDNLRFRVSDRSANSDLLIVEIDPASVRALGVWPWPRTFHAEVIRRLAAADARQIGIDIDFSSASTAKNDLDLQSALADAGGRVVLPVFQQVTDTPAGPILNVTAPMPMLQAHARLASVNVTPDRDGIVRSMDTTQEVRGHVLPTLAASLVDPRLQPSGRFGIDFSIDPRTLQRLSFAEVMAGHFDPGVVAGKAVLVGATAIELGDQLPVPLHRSLSGVLVQGLAQQSLTSDRAVHRLPSWLVVLLSAVGAFILQFSFGSGSLRRDAVVFTTFSLAVFGASSILFVASPILLDVTPILLVGGLVCAASIALRIDEQAVQLLLQRLRLTRVDTLLQRIVNDSFDGILIMDPDGRIQRGNAAAAQILGYDIGELSGLHIAGLFREEDGECCRAPGTKYLEPGAYEFDGQRRDGVPLSAEISVSRMQIGQETLLLAIVRDVSARKLHEVHLDYIAHHDTLTELPNRRYLDQLIDRSIAESAESARHSAVLIVDIDRLKDINETLGHAVGDNVLRETASRLRRALRSDDQIARLAGDQFCVLAPGVRDTAGAEEVAQRLLGCFGLPFRAGSLAVEIAAKVGIALYPDNGVDPATLLRCADVALHLAKTGSHRICCYDAAVDTTSVRRLAITSDLRRAIAKGDLILAFQPKIDLTRDDVCGAEALVRWQHPTYGVIPPDEFISHAEITGLIRPLTYWVLREGIRTLAELHRMGLPISISLNLSTKNLFDRDLPDAVLSLTRDEDLDPSFVMLEITENAMMHEPVRAIETAHRLRDHGFGLSIDDFGTGYSSLAYLRRLPVKELKIDKSFVAHIHESETDAKIVQSTISLAHALGLKVAAEGIELQSHVQLLNRFGCDIGQGYYFSRPLRTPEFVTWLIERKCGMQAFEQRSR